jgi:hypothetical protein
MQMTPPPNDLQRNMHSDLMIEYRASKQSVYLNRMGFLLSNIMLIMILWLRWHVPLKSGDEAAFYFMLIVSIGSALFFLLLLRRQMGYVVVLDNGIQQYLPNGSSHVLAWKDIKEIVTNRVIGQLELRPLNENDQRTVTLDFKLTDFARLKKLVYEKTSARDEDLLLTVFHRSNFLRVLFIIAGLMFITSGVVFLLRGRVIPTVRLFLFSAGVLIVRRFEITSVSFHDGYLSLNYPKHSLRIQFHEIKDVRIVSPKGIDIVVIETEDKGQLKLGGFREGSLAFYRKLLAVLPQNLQRNL